MIAYGRYDNCAIGAGVGEGLFHEEFFADYWLHCTCTQTKSWSSLTGRRFLELLFPANRNNRVGLHVSKLVGHSDLGAWKDCKSGTKVMDATRGNTSMLQICIE